jgi:hypothetical protein
MKRTLILFTALGVVGSAHAVVIDDFTTGLFSASYGGNAYFTGGATVPNAVGPLRYHSTKFNANPLFAQTFIEMLGDGKTYIETGPGVDAEVTLAWAGGLTSGTGTFGGGSLNANQFTAIPANLSGLTGFQVGYENADQNFDLVMGFIDTTNNVFELSTPVTVTAGTGSVVIPFSSINLTNINLASVDGVVFRAFMDHSQDVTITRLNAVPEPASMVALGAGLLALLRRSRRA